MFQFDSGKWATIGITSWGILFIFFFSKLISFAIHFIGMPQTIGINQGPKSCSGEHPGVYVAVHNYLEWLQEKMDHKGKYL